MLQYTEVESVTKEDARKILENYEGFKPWKDEDEEDIIHYVHIGDFFGEYQDAFAFAVYPYSSKEALDPEYAFKYFVDKETGGVSHARAPIPDWQLAEVKPPRV
jgi:hypothetical protein